jgi:DNA-binding NtrC family response regulator
LFEKSQAGAFRQDLYFRLSVVEILLPPLRARAGDIPVLVEQILSRMSAKSGGPRFVVSPAAMAKLVSYDWPGNIRELENILEMSTILSQDGVIEPHHLGARIMQRASIAGARPRDETEEEDEGSIRTAELQLLQATIQELEGNIALASRRLGMSRSTIYRRMKEYGISRKGHNNAFERA